MGFWPLCPVCEEPASSVLDLGDGRRVARCPRGHVWSLARGVRVG